MSVGKSLSTLIVTAVVPDVNPVTSTTTYVNIDELPLKGVIELLVNKVTNIPGVTLPLKIKGSILSYSKVIVFPELTLAAVTRQLDVIV